MEVVERKREAIGPEDLRNLILNNKYIEFDWCVS